MENIIVGIYLTVCGFICIWKGLNSSSKEKSLREFLKDNNTEKVEGSLKVVKIDYRYKSTVYVVKISFKNKNDELISVTKSFNNSLHNTKFLRKNKKKGKISITVFYDEKNPENFTIKEMKEVQYLRGEKWLLPFFGILCILLSITMFYYQFNTKM